MVNALNFLENFTSKYKTIYYKHIGIYGYKKDILSEMCQLPQSENEIEKKNLSN